MTDEKKQGEDPGREARRRTSKKKKKKAARPTAPASAEPTREADAESQAAAKAATPEEREPASAPAGMAAQDAAASAAAAGDAAVEKAKGAGADAPVPPKDTARAPGGPVRWVRGGALALVGFGATFLLMANVDQVPHGTLYGMLTTLLGIGGLLDLFGAVTGPTQERVSLRDTSLFPREGEPLFTSPVVTVPLAVAAFLIGAFAGGYDGLPIAILVALFPLFLSGLRRPGWMLAVIASGVLLPFLGVYGLWDPWETHYGEVAREILARDDWISLWWAQEDWFWSKPILIFWIEALSMGALGVEYMPDANPLHPEWAIRLPHFLLTMGALLSVYALVARVWSKRAGLLAGLVLATTPHFFFLAHQAITDMPFVTNMTMALAMLGLALVEDPSREVKRYGIGPITLSGQHLVIAAISAVVVPQILYLASRNVTYMGELPPFGWHLDVFLSGSAGNHGIPGNSAAHNVTPFLDGYGAQPLAQALVWLAGYLGILAILRNERRAQSLLMFAFYLFAGLAFMAKGIPGFALPGLVALFFLIGARRWDLLLEGRLRVGAGILTVLTVGLPWYVAMYVRHGPPFTDRLLIHDHINRLTAGVHGDTGSIEYFVEQMGYGLFPWIALAPLALAAWLAMPARQGALGASTEDAAAKRQRDILLLITMWLATAFTLFSAMTTKFHHYIFPAVPPAAILVGLAVHRLLAPEKARLELRGMLATGLAVLAPVAAIIGVAGLYGDVRGILPVGEEGTEWVMQHPWSTLDCALWISGGIGALAAAAWLTWRDAEVREASKRSLWMRGAMTTGLLAAPPVLAMVGRDLSWVTDARPQGYERLIHLFVYNYGRPWPTELDYRPILTGFAVVAVSVVLLAAVKPLRDVAMRAFLGVALAFSVWALDVYIVDLSPHWGQRELVQRYYEERLSAEDPLVAWQMNWKGENFYTGNRVSVFVQLDNQALRTWVGQNGGRTAYFLLERARLGSLRGVLGAAEVEELTDDRFCNKFMLARARLPVAARGSAPASAPDE